MPLAVFGLERITKLAILVKALGRKRRHRAVGSSVFLRQLGMILGRASLFVRGSGRGVSEECRSMETQSQDVNLLSKLCVALGST